MFPGSGRDRSKEKEEGEEDGEDGGKAHFSSQVLVGMKVLDNEAWIIEKSWETEEG